MVRVFFGIALICLTIVILAIVPNLATKGGRSYLSWIVLGGIILWIPGSVLIHQGLTSWREARSARREEKRESDLYSAKPEDWHD